MAMQQMADGRMVWLPDEIAPPFGQPDPAALSLLPGELSKHNDPTIPPPPPPPPPQKIGPGTPINDEVAIAGGDQMQRSITGGALPSGDQASGQGAGARPDFIAATVENDPKVIAAKDKAAAKAQAAQDKAQQAANARAATPDGQAKQAANEGMAAVGEQANIAQATGRVEAKELDESAMLEQAGLDRADAIRAQNEADAKKWQEGQAQKRADVDLAVKTEADYKIDDNRRWKEMGTGKTILFWISAALSGLGDALQKKSGPNMALQMMQAAIERDVNAQVRERENLNKRIGISRNSLDSYRSQVGEWRDAAKLKISEEYERTAQQIRVVASKYGSDKAKLRGEMLAEQLNQQAAAIRGQAADSAFGRDMQRANLKVSQGQLGLGYANLKQHKYEFGEQMKLEAAKLDAESQKAAAVGNAKQAEAIRELGVAGAPTIAKDDKGNPILDADGNPQIDRAAVLRNQDGTVYTAPTKEEAIKVRAKMGAANRLVDLLDEVRAIRERVGGESKWGNSDDYQRLQVLKDQLVIIKKAGTEGMSSDADMARIERALGADDPASFRAQAAKLDEGRAQVVKQINADLSAANYSGQPLDFPDPLKASKTSNTAEQVDVKNALSFAGVSKSTAAGGKGLQRGDENIGAWIKQGVAIPPSIKQLIDTHAATVATPGSAPVAIKQSGEYLQQLAKSARDPAVRAYAAQKLQENAAAATSFAPPPSEAIGPTVR